MASSKWLSGSARSIIKYNNLLSIDLKKKCKGVSYLACKQFIINIILNKYIIYIYYIKLIIYNGCVVVIYLFEICECPIIYLSFLFLIITTCDFTNKHVTFTLLIKP